MTALLSTISCGEDIDTRQHFYALPKSDYHFDALISVCRNVVSRFRCVDVFPNTAKAGKILREY